QLPLDALVWLPAGQSPHKADRAPASRADRVAMLQRMTEGEPRFSIDARELDRTGPSYTVDTLRELHAEQPGTRWWLVIGQDQYARFDTWHEWREILSLAGLAVSARDGDPVRAAPGLAGIAHALRIVEMPALPHSATTVRSRAAAGLDVTALVGTPVARYIADNNLYIQLPGAGS
ncbi:MAG: nicotinate (nicotinamide) nucleotide adenylyltransferase, partial [Caulobacter sp.]|nr:nicotinate (nicotinamide) nucleotide adenylyltransferase [Vitreoscilla sp.]